MLWADSAGDILVIFFLFFLENKKNLSKCHLLKFLPSMQSDKHSCDNEVLGHNVGKHITKILNNDGSE